MTADGETGRGWDEQSVSCSMWKSLTGAQMLEASLSGVGTVIRLQRDAWSIVE